MCHKIVRSTCRGNGARAPILGPHRGPLRARAWVGVLAVAQALHDLVAVTPKAGRGLGVGGSPREPTSEARARRKRDFDVVSTPLKVLFGLGACVCRFSAILGSVYLVVKFGRNRVIFSHLFFWDGRASPGHKAFSQ